MGNYTELYSEEKPSDLCEEANTTFCICAARENIAEENNVTEQPTWQFRCGACQLKWSVEKDEDESMEEEKKVKEKKGKKEKNSKKGKKDNTNKRKTDSNMKEAKPRSEN